MHPAYLAWEARRPGVGMSVYVMGEWSYGIGTVTCVEKANVYRMELSDPPKTGLAAWTNVGQGV
jgi:hypothetical protein